jgi:hypothetical protein
VFLFCFSSSCVPYGNKNTWWTPHHRVDRTKKNKAKTRGGHHKHRVHRTKKNKAKTRGGHHTIGYTGVHHVFLLCFSSSCVPYVCGVHHVFLFCFSSSCVPYGVVSTTCFCFVFLRPVYPNRTKKNKAKTRGGHHTIGYTGRRKTKQKHVVDTTP